MHKHPKQTPKQAYGEGVLKQPWESEGAMADCNGEVLKQTHTDKGHGGGAITRDDSDNAVENSVPYKNLK